MILQNMVVNQAICCTTNCDNVTNTEDGVMETIFSAFLRIFDFIKSKNSHINGYKIYLAHAVTRIITWAENFQKYSFQ